MFAAKYSGLFRLARLITRDNLRILCYHGFAVEDEHLFRPGMFVTPSTFTNRLNHLKRAGYKVAPLDDALAALDQGPVYAPTVVITIDDGFYSTLSIASTELVRHQFPATLYLTTYYVTKETPVFRLAVQYMFWKTPCSTIDLTNLREPRLSQSVVTKGTAAADELAWQVIQYGEKQKSETDRLRIEREIAQMLKVDFEHIVRARTMSLMNVAEAKEIVRRGIDVQLHTHRHCLGGDEAEVIREIEDNRLVIGEITQRPAIHMCYPSGIYRSNVWPTLKDANVVSGTTCDPGINKHDTNRLALRRILDSELLSQLEFEAEVSGFLPLAREVGSALVRTIQGLFRRPLREPATSGSTA
jgi:peptidoglycan/xylan/chitin deacetylase (PgdA/CDA1 family)